MLTVNDLMTVNPITITPDTSLRHIIGIMKQEGCRQLPVLDDGQLVGIITDRDVRLVMCSPLITPGRNQNDLLDKVLAEGIMTPTPVTVSPDTPAFAAAEMLGIYKFGALPVLANNILVGIITVTDFLDYFTITYPSESAFMAQP